MRIDVITLFPEILSGPLDASIMGRAQRAGQAEIHLHQLRDYAPDKHHIVDDKPYDHIPGYTNIDLSLILTSQDGWQMMGYVKNVFDTAAITGAFLNSDDTGLTTNVFLTDPRLFGVRVTKNW